MQKKQRATRHRSIDLDVENTYKDLRKRFALVSKMRANIWVTTALVVFFIGLVMGTAYVIDPSNLPIGQIKAMVGLAKLQTNTSTPNVAGNAGFYGNPTPNIPTNGGGGASNTGCVRNQLTISTTPISQQTTAGQAKTYPVKITNNDVGCSPVTFTITSQASRQYQSTGTVQTTGATLSNIASGSVGTTSITATPSSNASGEFIINITAKHPISTGYNNSLGANLLVGTGCIAGHPRVTPATVGNSSTVFNFSVTNGDSVTNSDGTLCPSSRFVVTSEAGPDSVAVNPSTFTLAPNAIKNVVVTIPSNSTQASVAIKAENKDTGKSWSASIPVSSGNTTGGTTGDCKVKPTVTVRPEQATNTANFTVTVKNNDSSACGAGLFNVTGRPNESTDLTKWQQQPPTAGGTIAPGTTKTFAFSVNGSSAAPGTYNYLFSVQHPNDLGGTLTGNAFARFCVGASGSSCGGGGTGGGNTSCSVAPTVTISPTSRTKTVGQNANYKINVHNNNASTCPYAWYDISATSAENPRQLAISSIPITIGAAAGQTGTTGAQIKVDSLSTTPSGSYPFTVTLTDQSNASIHASVTGTYQIGSSTSNSTSFWRRVLDFINPN